MDRDIVIEISTGTSSRHGAKLTFNLLSQWSPSTSWQRIDDARSLLTLFVLRPRSSEVGYSREGTLSIVRMIDTEGGVLTVEPGGSLDKDEWEAEWPALVGHEIKVVHIVLDLEVGLGTPSLVSDRGTESSLGVRTSAGSETGGPLVGWGIAVDLEEHLNGFTTPSLPDLDGDGPIPTTTLFGLSGRNERAPHRPPLSPQNTAMSESYDFTSSPSTPTTLRTVELHPEDADPRLLRIRRVDVMKHFLRTGHSVLPSVAEALVDAGIVNPDELPRGRGAQERIKNDFERRKVTLPPGMRGLLGCLLESLGEA